MEKSMNPNILEKLEEILDLIKDSQDYQDYVFLKAKLAKNEKALKLIAEVKKLQKQVVRKEVKKEDTSQEEQEIEKLLESLNQIPLYLDFVETQQKLNEVYQMIDTKLDNYFQKIGN